MAQENELRSLPSVDKLLSQARIEKLRKEFSHETVVDIARQHLEELRISVQKGNACPSFAEITANIAGIIQSLGTIGPRPVINATGVRM